MEKKRRAKCGRAHLNPSTQDAGVGQSQPNKNTKGGKGEKDAAVSCLQGSCTARDIS